MRIVSFTSPLLTLALTLVVVPSVAQESDDVSEEEYSEDDVSEDEYVEGEEDKQTSEPAPAEPAPSSDVAASDEEEVEAAPAGSPGGAEEGLWDSGEQPFRPAPAGKGVVWGRIVDSKDGEPAIEAEVKVAGRNVRVYTDFDGYYRLELPPGNYKLELFYELHEPETLDGVVSTLGRVTRLDADLKPQAGAVEEVLIEDEAESQSVQGLALIRQRAVSQGDAIGREEISRSTDSNAAEAAQRVVGANIVGGRFVYVRGLGERYSNSLLSGYPLPSPEPDRAAVPLDVFPSAVLDSLTINKTFTPDMPADFAGGSVQIETRSVPREPLFQVSLTGGINTQSTFQDRLDYSGSSTDFLGFDNGSRALPGSVPPDQKVESNAENPNSRLTEADTTRIGRDVNSGMSPNRSGTPVNHGFSVVGGNTWELGRGQKLGVLASLNYSRKFKKIEDMVLKEYRINASDDRGFDERIDYRVDMGRDEIRWGGFGKLSYILSPKHKIFLTGLHSQLADDTTRLFTGWNAQAASRFTASQLSWIERGLTFGLLSGRHEFDELNHAELGWDMSVASAFRNEPDRRDIVYRYNGRLPNPEGGTTTGWQYQSGDESGRHFWSGQKENSFGGKMDWTQPLVREDAKTILALKTGGLVNVKERSFSARRLTFYPNQGVTSGRDPIYNCLGDYRIDCPDRLFRDSNISDVIFLRERPQPGDGYNARLNVYAAYGMLDWELSRSVRLAGGTRVEWTDQRVDPYSPVGESVRIPNAAINAVDALPALALVLSPSDKTKTRYSYARTLARPQVREIAPFAFSDYFGGRVVTGNPNLVLTQIDNFDARFEYWPSLSEVLAFTVFLKHLTNPIEQILIPADNAPQVTYANTPEANVIGLELEARKNLEFLTDVLSDVSVISNLTLTYSRTEVPQTGNMTITNPSRSLINQSPWVLNVILDYTNALGTTARLAYNVNGATLVEVGTDGIPDGFMQPFHSLDFSLSQSFAKSWNLKLQVENIVNDDVVITQGSEERADNLLRRYREGTIFSLGLGYEL